MKQDIYEVTTTTPPRHVGTVKINPGRGFNWNQPNELTAAETDALCDELRAAANKVRTHNQGISRTRFP